MDEETNGDHPYFVREQRMAARFDEVTQDLAMKYFQGRDIEWLPLT